MSKTNTSTLKILLFLFLLIAVITSLATTIYWLNNDEAQTLGKITPESFPADYYPEPDGEEVAADIQYYTNAQFPTLKIPYDAVTWTVSESSREEKPLQQFPIITVTFSSGENTLVLEFITGDSADGSPEFECFRKADVDFLDPQTLKFENGNELRRYLSRYKSDTQAAGKYSATYAVNGYPSNDPEVMRNPEAVSKIDKNPNICFSDFGLATEAKLPNGSKGYASISASFKGDRPGLTKADELMIAFTSPE